MEKVKKKNPVLDICDTRPHDLCKLEIPWRNENEDDLMYPHIDLYVYTPVYLLYMYIHAYQCKYQMRVYIYIHNI